MDEQKYKETKEKLWTYLATLGLEEEEANEFFLKEVEVSKKIGMNEHDSNVRALVATINYYRKYLDKIGNRVQFLCIGVTAPTDYGLRKKVSQIERLYNELSTTENTRRQMVNFGLVDESGTPLHHDHVSLDNGDTFPPTTLFQDMFGQRIDLAESVSQELFGIIKNDSKLIPSVVRVNGKKACNEEKYMYRWCSISAEQKDSSKYAQYAFLTTRELLMKPIKNEKERITIDEYKELVETVFANDLIDCNEDDALQKMKEAKPINIMKNVQMTPYTFQAGATTTHLYPSKHTLLLDNNVILANARISKEVLVDVDPNTLDDKYLCVKLRPLKENDLRITCDIYGMYSENPVDMKMFEVDAEFFETPEKETILIPKSTRQKSEVSEFFQAIQKRQE